MRIRFTYVVAALFSLAAFLPAAAQQDKGYWTAASSNALAITGDVRISDARLTINYANFPLAQIRALKPDEAAAVFDADSNTAVSGKLYRLSVPAEKQFLHHNTLCGSDDTEWMVTYTSGRSLQLAFFSGTDAPALTIDALAHSSSLCGTFSYAR
jgi:hypothetical protein